MKEIIAKVVTVMYHVMLKIEAWTSENGCGLLGVIAQWVNANLEYYYSKWESKVIEPQNYCNTNNLLLLLVCVGGKHGSHTTQNY